MTDGGVVALILKAVSDYTSPFIGALLGSGWVQSRYPKMTRMERFWMGLFTMGCVMVAITSLVSFAAIWAFPFPKGLFMLAAFVTSIVCIPFAKWLTKNSENIFNKISTKILPDNSNSKEG